MLREFEGDPQRALKGIAAVPQHGDALRGGKVSDADQRLIAEWLGADFLPEADDDAAEQPAPRTAAASAPVAAPSAVPSSVPPVAATPPAAPVALPTADPDLQKPVAPVSGPAVSAVRLQSLGAAGGERLIVELRGGEPDSVDMSMVGNRLVMSFVGAGLAGAAARIDADGAFKVIESVDTQIDGRNVTITVVPRDAGWTYSGMQGRNRMVVDFKAQPKAVLAAKEPAKQSTEQPAKQAAAPGRAAKSAAGKPSAATGTALAGVASAGGAVAASAATAAKAGAVAKTGEKPGAAPAKLENSAAASKAAEQRAAEQKAAEQAKAQELARKAELARAAEQAKAREQAEAVARAEAAARAKVAEEAATRRREQERAAEPAKAPATALAKAELQPDVVWQEGDAGGKPRRKVSKRPYKEPNLAPCPPPNPADQVIGVVDVERAKEIIDRIGCPQCHAYVQKKTGPPFREVLKKYKGDPACVIHRLKTNETHKDEGVTADIRPDEFKILADYVATRMK